MDRNTMSEFGWVVIVLILLAIMLAAVHIIGPMINDAANQSVEEFFGTSSVIAGGTTA